MQAVQLDVAGHLQAALHRRLHASQAGQQLEVLAPHSSCRFPEREGRMNGGNMPLPFFVPAAPFGADGGRVWGEAG